MEAADSSFHFPLATQQCTTTALTSTSTYDNHVHCTPPQQKKALLNQQSEGNASANRGSNSAREEEGDDDPLDVHSSVAKRIIPSEALMATVFKVYEDSEGEDYEGTGRKSGHPPLTNSSSSPPSLASATLHGDYHHHHYSLSLRDIKIICHILGIKAKLAAEVTIRLAEELLLLHHNGAVVPAQDASSSDKYYYHDDAVPSSSDQHHDYGGDSLLPPTRIPPPQTFSSFGSATPTPPPPATDNENPADSAAERGRTAAAEGKCRTTVVVPIAFSRFAAVAFRVLSVNSRVPFDINALRWTYDDAEEGKAGAEGSDEEDCAQNDHHRHDDDDASDDGGATKSKKQQVKTKVVKKGNDEHPARASSSSPSTTPSAPPSAPAFAPFRHLLTVAMAVVTHRTALVLLCGGTSGTGKTTLASLLGARLGIKTIVSTDHLREATRYAVKKKEEEEEEKKGEEATTKESAGEKEAETHKDCGKQGEDRLPLSSVTTTAGVREPTAKVGGGESAETQQQEQEEQLRELFVSTYEAHQCPRTRQVVKAIRQRQQQQHNDEEVPPSVPATQHDGDDDELPTAAVVGHRIQSALVLPSLVTFIKERLRLVSAQRKREEKKRREEERRQGKERREGGEEGNIKNSSNPTPHQERRDSGASHSHSNGTNSGSCIIEGVHLTTAVMEQIAYEVNIKMMMVEGKGKRGGDEGNTEKGPRASSSSSLFANPPRAIVVPTLIHIEKAEQHQQRFAVRASVGTTASGAGNAPSSPQQQTTQQRTTLVVSENPLHNKYIAQFKAIRAIQQDLVAGSVRSQEAYVAATAAAAATSSPTDTSPSTAAASSPTRGAGGGGDGSGARSYFPILRVLNSNVDRSVMRIHVHTLKLMDIVGRGRGRSNADGGGGGEMTRKNNNSLCCPPSLVGGGDDAGCSSSPPSSFWSRLLLSRLSLDCLADHHKKQAKAKQLSRSKEEKSTRDKSHLLRPNPPPDTQQQQKPKKKKRVDFKRQGQGGGAAASPSTSSPSPISPKSDEGAAATPIARQQSQLTTATATVVTTTDNDDDDETDDGGEEEDYQYNSCFEPPPPHYHHPSEAHAARIEDSTSHTAIVAAHGRSCIADAGHAHTEAGAPHPTYGGNAQQQPRITSAMSAKDSLSAIIRRNAAKGKAEEKRLKSTRS